MSIFGMMMPWETADKEGFIAPWSKKVETPAGIISEANAAPGSKTLSTGEAMAIVKARNSMPAGAYAGHQEVMQSVSKQDSLPGNVNPEQTLFTNIPGVNTGQPGGAGAGQDMDADQGGVGAGGGNPQQAGVIGGTLGEALGLGAAGTALLTLGLSRMKFPWQTPTGEGFIAPWTNMTQLASGLWGQDAIAEAGGYNDAGTALASATNVPAAPDLGSMNYATLKGGVPVKTWTNASKNGATPATVQFVQFSNGYVASRSLIDGSIKMWKPKKHIVLSSNPRLSQIGKLDRTYRRVGKRIKKMKAFK